MAADLLRAPPLAQQLANHLAQLEAGLNATPMMPHAAHHRTPVRLERTVTPAPGRIPAQLPRDRRRGPTQQAADVPSTQPRAAQVGDLDPFVLRQEPRADLTHASRSNAGTNPTTLPRR
jgi:hypothetical protein